MDYQTMHTEAVWYDAWNYPPSPNNQKEMDKFDYEEEERQQEAERKFQEEEDNDRCPTCGHHRIEGYL